MYIYEILFVFCFLMKEAAHEGKVPKAHESPTVPYEVQFEMDIK